MTMAEIRLVDVLMTALTLLVTAAQSAWIVPGARWYDTDGNLFNAHAGGLCVDRDTGRFYWFGEYKTEGQEEGGGVSVYSSDDLATWTSHGLALEPIEGHEYISPENIIQRPKVEYSQENGKYHMWWHADDANYSLLLQGHATSDDIAGPYRFDKAVAPMGNWSQDFGMFTDRTDGRTYALYSNGDSAEGRDVYLSRFDGALNGLEDVVHRWDKFDLEAPTIIQTDTSYYALMSHKTGYRPNNVVAFRADSLEGPWSQPWMISDPYTRTWSSQSGYTFRIDGSQATTYLYMGDQWDSNSLWESRNIWLPLSIDDGGRTLSLPWHDVYDLDVRTGVWRPVTEGVATYRPARTTGSAYFQEANFATGGELATGIRGNRSSVVFEGVQGHGGGGGGQWVSFYHQNTDDMGYGDQPGGSPDRIGGAWQLRRISGVVVNDDEDNVYSLYQRDTHKGVIVSSPLKLPLRKGANKITVGGLSNGFDDRGADIDRIVVYPPEEESLAS
ncbi:Galactan 1,3-beta-galactosidase [Geosmithia morbida]|uniref:Galactan 1,3-beta-galactosidase n=1 Tax=Geosmithia morbida TaxID=1094350 RepID=A0A9P4YYE3_9HYPO|nr:Galactan 1,3-beta-galactosidase [Geosmithia morbida]KAF4124031.1 Galactan 1,3-beta-galactosidase [Geosmithia morbida]